MKGASNIVKIVVRGHLTADERAWILSEKNLDDDTPFEVVDYAIGYEGSDEDMHHEHTHVVLRTSAALPPDTDVLRSVYDLETWTNLQDIRLGDDFQMAAKYACKSGRYEWPNQYIPPPWDDPNPEWYDCQKAILDDLQAQNMRQILCVVDTLGNSGKTYLIKWHALRFKATSLPISNNYKDLMRFAFDLHIKQHMSLNTVFIDIPRSFPKNNLRALYSAIETLKDGTIWDDRWSLDMRIDIPPPRICVMTNAEPDMSYLTADRWLIQHIRPDGSVVRSRASYVDWVERQKGRTEEQKRRHRLAQQRYREKKQGITII